MATRQLAGIRHLIVMAVLLISMTFTAQPVQAQNMALPELPQLRPGPVMSLSQAVRLAETQNRSLKVIRADLLAAAAKLKGSWAILLPNLYGNMAYTLNDHATTSQQNGVTVETRQQHVVTAGLQASLPLIAAQRWVGVDAARSEDRLASLSVEAAEQELLYGVAEAYYQAATLHRLITVYDSQFSALTRHLESARVRYRSGVGQLLDVKQAETDLVGVREEQISAIYALEDARDALMILTAQGEPPLPGPQPQSVPETTAGAADEIPTLSARWDLRLAEQQLSVAESQLTAQWMQFVPTVNASWQFSYDVTTPDNPLPYDRSRWFIGLVLTVPLFDYSFYPALQSQRAGAYQARLQLEDTQQQAQNAYTQARRQVAKLEQLVAAARIKAKLADDSLQLAQTNYSNGRGSALTVIDAQRISQTAHVSLESRILEYELAKLAWHFAVGQSIDTLLR